MPTIKHRDHKHIANTTCGETVWYKGEKHQVLLTYEKATSIMLELALSELVLKAYTSYTVRTKHPSFSRAAPCPYSSLADKCNCLDDEPT